MICCFRYFITLFSYLYRHLNWTLKSLKVCYGRDNEQLPLKSFTPELSFPQSSLELLLEGKWTAGRQTYCRESWKEKEVVNNTLFFFFFFFFFCWQMDFCCLKVGKEFFVWTQSRQPCRWGKCFKATLHRFVNQLLRLSPSCLCEFRLHQLTSQGQSSSTLASFTTVTRSFPIGSIYFHGNSYSTGRKHTEKGKL